MTDKSWYSIVLENWSQIAVLLGIIGYIIQLLVNWHIKKLEISFSKVQEMRIQEVKAFYKSYKALRTALTNFLNQTIFGPVSDEEYRKILNETRKEINRCLIEFDYNCMVVKLLIEKTEINTIDEIFDTCESIRIDIEKWHIYKGSRTQPDDWHDLSEIREERLEKILPNLIKIVESSLRRSYKIS